MELEAWQSLYIFIFKSSQISSPT